MSKERKKVIYGFSMFLAFMAVCTLIAKGIYTSGLARVTMGKVQSLNISHKITGLGSVVAGQEYGVYVIEGLRVHTIFVKVGDSVKAGEALFQVKEEDLEQMLSEKEQLLKQIKAQFTDYNIGQQKEKGNRQKQVTRIQQDYDSLIREQDIQIKQRQIELEIAKQNLKRQEELASVSGGNGANTDMYQLAVNQATIALEAAILNKEEAVKNWSRSMEDAKNEAEWNGETAQRINLNQQITQLEEECEELRELRQAEGIVYAKETGTIISSQILIGERTMDTACMLYAKESDKVMVEVTLTSQDMEFISIGDIVTLSYKSRDGESKHIEAPVDFIENYQDFGVARFLLSEADKISIGQLVDVEYVSKSELYSIVIPKYALHKGEMGDFYVYVVEEQEGILGMENRIRETMVTVLEENYQFAAIQSEFLTKDSVIVMNSNKDITENDIVRIVE